MNWQFWRKRAPKRCEYKFFPACPVIIERFIGRVNVKLSDDSRIHIVSNETQCGDTLLVDATNGRLRISDKDLSAEVVRLANVAYAGNGVRRRHRKQMTERGAMIEVYVPRGTKIVVRNVEGPVNIGDIEGEVNLVGGNSCKTMVGCVRKLWTQLNGAGDVVVRNITTTGYIDSRFRNRILVHHAEGYLFVRNRALEQVVIIGGRLERLDLQTTSIGRIECYAEAARAKLVAKKTGAIRIDSAEQLLAIIAGFARVVVEKGFTNLLELRTAGFFEHKGIVGTIKVQYLKPYACVGLRYLIGSCQERGKHFGRVTIARPTMVP